MNCLEGFDDTSMSDSQEKTFLQSKGLRPGQWKNVALQWHYLGPPVRPSDEDVKLYIKGVQDWGKNSTAPRVLLLGVTPELFYMPWPSGTNFLAVDHTEAMIEAVWPGPKDAVINMEWLDISLPKRSRDIVLCDGGLHILSYPKEQRQLVKVLSHIIPEGGLCIFRVFLPPKHKELPDAVIDDLLARKIPNLNILKFRLWMALQKNDSEGVELEAVWQTIHDAAGSIETLARRIGWPLEHTLVINAYHNSKARYHFSTLDEVIKLFYGDRGEFEMYHLFMPTYELGTQCPIIVFKRSSSFI